MADQDEQQQQSQDPPLPPAASEYPEETLPDLTADLPEPYLGDPELDAAENLYITMHSNMMARFHAKDHDEADRIAVQLLTTPNIPLLIRAHCHMVLGTGDGEYLRNAREAVRILEQLMNEDEPPRPVHLEQARKVLAKAEEDHAKEEAGEIEFGEGEDEEGGGEEEGLETIREEVEAEEAETPKNVEGDPSTPSRGPEEA